LNITYGDYGGFINPFDPVQQPLNDDEDNVSQVLHSSFNGIILVRDRFTDQVMWARKLSSIAISFFKLAESIDGDSTSQYLIKLPIASLGSEAQQADLIKRFKEIPIQEQAVTVGNSDGCLFVLPADQFPTLVEEVRHDRPLSKDALTVAVTDEKVSDSSHQITPDYDCRPGHPDFPNCLLGNRRAQVIQPVPLLGPASKNEKIFWWPLMMTIVIVLTSTVMVIYVTRRRPEGATVVTEPSLIGRLPPGFEEISIGRAESMYTIQTESSDISPPTSFVISDEIVGYGSHGTVVFKGEYDGRPVAIKRMLADFYDLAGHEVALLQQSDHHPNVIRYFFRERTEKFVYIVLELCVGSLADLIDGADIRRREELEGLLVDPKSLLEQVTRGLGHLHAMKLIHRDIKPHNILITPQKRLVISDFGLGKKLIDNQSSFHPTIQSGTVGWRAPESILNEEATELSKLGATSQPVGIKISKSVDIFALGCVFFYVLTRGEHPFGSRLQREMNIINNKYDISKLDSVPDAADLILRLIDRRPEKRPNCQQILAHPYFWPAQKQVAFLQDLSDRFEFEDRKPSSAIIDAFESRRKVIFEGNNAWNRLLDSKVWYDLCSYRRYNGHSARDLLRALRNKRSHFHELSKELRAIVGETPEAFMGYFLERFPRLLIEAYRLVETTELRNENTFASVYF
jgi:serine/threonine-protein kinase/endoribonuclease IRE1